MHPGSVRHMRARRFRGRVLGGTEAGDSPADHPLSRVLVIGDGMSLGAAAREDPRLARARVVRRAEALRAARESPPTLVLMPVRDALDLDLFRALLREHPDAPIVVAAGGEAARAAARAGAFATVSAAPSADELRKVLHEAADEHEEQLVPRTA